MWPKFQLIQAFMVALVTCENEEDPIKSEGDRVVTTPCEFFQMLKGSKLRSPLSKFAEF